MPEGENTDLTTLTVQLLSAYVSNNTVASDDLAALIKKTREALGGTAEPEGSVEPVHVPAVTARKSLGSRDFIISMIDGKPYKTLKRHLAGHGLTPDEYRERYNLPKTYPMVAPSYSEHRRDVAKRLGLGRKPREAAPAASAKPAVKAPPKVATPKKAAATKQDTKPAEAANQAAAKRGPKPTAAAGKARKSPAKSAPRKAAASKAPAV